MLGVVEDSSGGAAFHHHPMVEYHRFIGELAYDGQVVADHEIGDAGLVADVGEQVQHLGLDRDVEGGGGFVEDEHGGLAARTRAIATRCRWPPDSDRQHARPTCVQADQAGEFGNAGSAAFRWPPVVQPEHFVDGGFGALARIEAGVRVLEHDLDLPAPSAPVAGRPRRTGTITPAGGDDAAGRPLQADDHPRDRGLPGTGLPGNGKRAARLKLEADIVDGDELAILLAQSGCLQDRRAATVRHRMPGEAGRVARGRGRTG